eukprot:1137490-Pelagomonas_calceolata.AAC.2
MDSMLTGEDQSQAGQQNSLAKGPPFKQLDKGKSTQAAHASSVVLTKGQPPPPQGLELGTPRRLDPGARGRAYDSASHRNLLVTYLGTLATGINLQLLIPE